MRLRRVDTLEEESYCKTCSQEFICSVGGRQSGIGTRCIQYMIEFRSLGGLAFDASKGLETKWGVHWSCDNGREVA